MRWVLIAVGIGLFFAFFTGPKSLFKLYSLYQERETLTREKMQLQKETKKLDDEIHKLQTDEKYIEKMAREKNKMKKKGEQVYEVDPQ